MLSVFKFTVGLLIAVMLNVIALNVIILSVIMLVVAELQKCTENGVKNRPRKSTLRVLKIDFGTTHSSGKTH
jgi:hypothetical protein